MERSYFITVALVFSSISPFRYFVISPFRVLNTPGVIYGKKSICLSRIYRQAVAMTLCFELQQSHEMDYVLRDEVYTRYLANTYFARKRSDVGCLYQIDTVYTR